MQYYKQLDALRFFSVLMVMIAHWVAWDTTNEFIQSFHWGNGVIFFFVLSGFLITEILYKQKLEIEKGNSSFYFSLKNFYFRRTLRIFPIYYLLIFFLFFVNYKNTREIFPYLVTYTSNILQANTTSYVGDFNHFWSLAVEEQFYIVWPVCILFIPKKHLLKFILSTITLSVFSRMAFIYFMPDKWMAAGYLTNNVMFALGIGAMLAYFKQERTTLFSKISKSIWLTPFMIMFYLFSLFIIAHHFPVSYMVFIFDEFIFCILSAVIISRAVGSGYQFLGKIILENKYLSHLGQISYGLYLYHLFAIPTFWDYISPALDLHSSKKITIWVLYFVFTWLAAEISYSLIERPFNSLKKYFK